MHRHRVSAITVMMKLILFSHAEDVRSLVKPM